jgi:hypothetical protein
MNLMNIVFPSAVAAASVLTQICAVSAGPYDSDLGQTIENYLAPGGAGYSRAIGQSLQPNNQLTKCQNVGCPPFPDPFAAAADARISGLGAVFFQAGVQYNIDPRLILAIAHQETAFGSNWNGCLPTLQTFNAWNFFHTHTRCIDPGYQASPFSSYQSGISMVADHLRNLYISKGFTTIELIGRKWCQGIMNPSRTVALSPGCSNWAAKVLVIYRDELHGDPTDLSFKPSCPVATSTWDADAPPAGSLVGGVNIVGPSALIGWTEGSAFSFDGSSGYIDLGAGTGQFGTGAFSLEAWFNWNGSGSGVSNIIRKSNFPVSSPGAGYWMRITGSGLEFFIGETLGLQGYPRTSIFAGVTPGSWHHVVGTKGVDGVMSLYLDGQLAGTGNIDPSFNVDSL